MIEHISQGFSQNVIILVYKHRVNVPSYLGLGFLAVPLLQMVANIHGTCPFFLGLGAVHIPEIVLKNTATSSAISKSVHSGNMFCIIHLIGASFVLRSLTDSKKGAEFLLSLTLVLTFSKYLCLAIFISLSHSALAALYLSVFPSCL